MSDLNLIFGEKCIDDYMEINEDEEYVSYEDIMGFIESKLYDELLDYLNNNTINDDRKEWLKQNYKLFLSDSIYNRLDSVVIDMVEKSYELSK